jgi:hypothetical protein
MFYDFILPDGCNLFQIFNEQNFLCFTCGPVTTGPDMPQVNLGRRHREHRAEKSKNA